MMNAGNIVGAIVMDNSESLPIGDYFIDKGAAESSKALTFEIFNRLVSSAELWTREHIRALVSNNYYYQFYYLHTQRYTIFAVAEPGVKQRSIYALLDAIHLELQSNQSLTHRALQKRLKYQIQYWNDPQTDKIMNIQNQIEQVRDTMVENLDQVLGRTVQLERIAVNTEQLAYSGSLFQKTSRRYKCWTICKGILCCAWCP
jgi:hypothetical protein